MDQPTTETITITPERLREAHFQAIQRLGRRVSTKHFVLIVAQTREPGVPSRIGITASKKVGNAVVRNRWKRRTREAFRGLLPDLPPGLDLVVLPRRGARLDSEAIQNSLRKLVRRLARRCEKSS